MAMSIEAQFHAFAIEKEEQRCRVLEEKCGKPVKRKKIKPPWKRAHPQGLCQDSGLLLIISDYDYDLSDKEFQAYCLDRGTLHIAGESGSKRWDFFLDHSKTNSEFMNDRYFQHAERTEGKEYRFTEPEMEAGWTTIRLGRATLQDCWELYCKGGLE